MGKGCCVQHSLYFLTHCFRHFMFVPHIKFGGQEWSKQAYPEHLP